MFGRPASGLRHGRAAQAALDRPVCGPRRGRHLGRPAHGVPHLAARDGRGAPDEEVTALDQLDQTIDRAADKLQELADKAAGQNGLKGKLAQPLAEDAAFLRKLKPSLVAARARGQAPTGEKPGAATKQVAEHASALARLELELAKLEVSRKIAALGLGIGLGLGAAVLALFAVAFLLAAAAAGLATAISTWLALLLVGLGLFLVTGLLRVLALRNIKKGTPPVPEQAIREAQLTQTELKSDAGS